MKFVRVQRFYHCLLLGFAYHYKIKRPEESLKITTKQRRRLCRLVGVVGAICHTTNKILL